MAAFIDIYSHDKLLLLIKSHHVPFPFAAMVGGITLKLVAGLGLMFYPTVKIAALALILFTFIATIIFKNFWARPQGEKLLAFLDFSTMFALMGGLLGLTGT